jgi:uncharacterized OB-fold protein
MTQAHEVVHLREAEFRQKVIAVEHSVRAHYSWDTGIAIGRYLEGLKQAKIVGRVCFECRRRLVPPRMFCEQCFRSTDEWVEVGDHGVVSTFSICFVTWDMKPLKVPEIPAVIELDGASKGIGILHKVGNVDPDDVHVGMKVRAVWKPAAEREGSILDIKYFQPSEPVARRGRFQASKKARSPGRPKPASTRKAKGRHRGTGGGV